jgi:hypothetical protein
MIPFKKLIASFCTRTHVVCSLSNYSQLEAYLIKIKKTPLGGLCNFLVRARLSSLIVQTHKGRVGKQSQRSWKARSITQASWQNFDDGVKGYSYSLVGYRLSGGDSVNSDSSSVGKSLVGWVSVKSRGRPLAL